MSILIFASATFPIPSKRELRDFSHLPPAGACPRAGRRPDPGAGAGTGPLPGRPALAGSMVPGDLYREVTVRGVLEGNGTVPARFISRRCSYHYIFQKETK